MLGYENKRGLSFETLQKYRKMIVKKHMDYHSQFSEYDDEDFENSLHEFHNYNTNISLDEERKLFNKFIKDNEDMFFYKDGMLYLKENISYQKLEDRNFELDSYSDRDDKIICGELLSFHDSTECLDVLDAKKMKNTAIAISNDEKKVEKAYQEYLGTGLEEGIQKLAAPAYYKLSLIGNLPNDKMSCYFRLFCNLIGTDKEAKGKDIELYSDDLMENDEFYKLNEQYNDILPKRGYNKAIFNTGTLVYDKITNIINSFWTFIDPDSEPEFEPVDPEATAKLMEENQQKYEEYEDEFDDEDDDDDYDEEDEDYNEIEHYLHQKNVNYAFYLNFIKNIDKYTEEHGTNEELNLSKSRLLYLLDGYGDNLYIKQYFNNAYDFISMDDIEYKDDFYDFYTLSRLFLVDILEGWIDDELTIKKLLFASTYYNLTKDKRIEKIIEKYKSTELGEKISKIILNGDYNLLVPKNNKNYRKNNI